jgi:hypothetical protein
MEVYFAKCNQVKRCGELIFKNSRNHMEKSAVKAGKRAANPRATSCRAPISAKSRRWMD